MDNDEKGYTDLDIPEVEVSPQQRRLNKKAEKLRAEYNSIVSKWQEELVIKSSDRPQRKTEKQISESEALFHEAQKSYYQVDTKIDTFISNFVDNQNNAAKQKKKLKTVFFIVTMIVFGVIVLIPFITLFVLIGLKVEEASIYVSTVLGGTVEILTTVIVLPKIVAEYLFNKEEENSNIKIVELMQKYSETMHSYENKENGEK